MKRKITKREVAKACVNILLVVNILQISYTIETPLAIT